MAWNEFDPLGKCGHLSCKARLAPAEFDPALCCLHDWCRVSGRDGYTCRICEARCTRGADGKIETYERPFPEPYAFRARRVG